VRVSFVDLDYNQTFLCRVLDFKSKEAHKRAAKYETLDGITRMHGCEYLTHIIASCYKTDSKYMHSLSCSLAVDPRLDVGRALLG